MPIKLIGDWKIAEFSLGYAQKNTKRAMKKALAQEANFLRKKVVQGMRKQAPGGQKFKPLSKTTLAIRRFRGFGGRKALIDRGDLIGSINVTLKNGGNLAFIGVLKTARSRKGTNLVNVAAIHEFGFGPIVIKMTPKMRRFFFAALGKSRVKGGGRAGSSGGVFIIKIPARPFFRPTFAKYAKKRDIGARYMARVAENLNGAMGKPNKKPPK